MKNLKYFTLAILFVFFISETLQAQKTNRKRSSRSNPQSERVIKPEQQLTRSIPKSSTQRTRPTTNYALESFATDILSVPVRREVSKCLFTPQ